jgi:tetratricopeptide (TPR) repeat protein
MIVAAVAVMCDDAKEHVEPFVALFGLMLVVSVVPALPLPSHWVERLAPSVLAHHRETAQGLGLASPSWVPLSIDPGNTYDRIVFGVGVAAVFGAARVFALISSSTSILATVALSTTLVAASHLGHRMFGAKAVYGLYVPTFVPATGPLLNQNNFAGFMCLGLPVCLGLGLRARGIRRWLWWLAGAVVAAAGLLTGSRAGTALLVAGPLLFGLLHWVRDRTDGLRPRRSDSVPARVLVLEVAGLLAMIGGIAYGLAELAADDFVDTDFSDLSKLDLLRAEAAALFETSTRTWFGVGRGAFAASFAALNSGPKRVLFAECLPLQFAIEYGVALTALLVLGTLWRVLVDFWRWRSPAHLAGMVGVFALTLQNLVDYSLEMSGIAIPAAACFAAALPQLRGSELRRFKAFPLLTSVRLTAVLCAILVLSFAPSAWSTDSLWQERRLAELSSGDQAQAFWPLARQAAVAHPATPIFATLIAGQAVTEHCPQAPFWLNRAMALAPGWGTPHLWAAQWLVGQGRANQALGELELAAKFSPKQALNVLCQLLLATPLADLVLRVAPESGASRTIILDGGARCLSSAPAQAAQVDEEILRREPDHVDARVRQIRRQLAQQQFAVAIKDARALQRSSPDLAAAYIAEAEGLQGTNEPEKAIEVLLRGVPSVTDRRALLGALAWAYVAARNEPAVRDTVDQLRVEAGSLPWKQAATMMLLGRCEAALGNEARALKALREAVTLGAGPEALAAAAELATKLGQLDFARQAWSELCQLNPHHPRFCRARDQLLQDALVP